MTDPHLLALEQRLTQLQQAYTSAQALADQHAADLVRYRAGTQVRDQRIAELERECVRLRAELEAAGKAE